MLAAVSVLNSVTGVSLAVLRGSVLRGARLCEALSPPPYLGLVSDHFNTDAVL